MDRGLSAFVFGGTGSIGGGIVKALAKEPKFSKVMLFGRRKMEFPEASPSENYSKFEQETIDFENLNELSQSRFEGYDVGFYALGVSSAKVDEATYRKVEHDYTVTIAGLVKDVGCPHFNWVSGRGADKDSWFLFGKVKQQVEEELKHIGFPRLSIFQPAAVLNADCRIGLCLSKTLDKGHKISIDNESLGKVIVGNALQRSEGSEILTMADIARLEKDFEQNLKN